MAGRLKKKVRINFNLFETTNSNRLKTGGALTAYIYAGGMQVESNTVIPTVSTISGTLSGRGALASALQAVRVVRINDADAGLWAYVDTGGQAIRYTNLEEAASTPGSFSADFEDTNAIGLTMQPGDRLVSPTLATLYEDEGDEADTISQPIDVPTHGVVEFYVEDDSVDVYLTGSAITDGWYGFNLPAGPSTLGALLLSSETLAADVSGDVKIDSRTGIALINSSANTIDSILHGTADRMVLLIPTVSGVQLQTSTSTTGDGHIYDAAGSLITLNQNVPVLLVCREGATASDHYWTILGTPNTIDFNLNELLDVVITAPDDFHPLVYDGANWVNSDTLGTAAVPIQELRVWDEGFFLQTSATITAGIDANALSASRTYFLPDISGTFVLSGNDQDVDGRKTFEDGAGGIRIANAIDGTKIVNFDASGITTGTIWTLTIPDKSGTIATLGDTPDTIDDLTDVVITAAADEDILKYDTGTSKWVNSKALGSAANPISDLILEDDGLQIQDQTAAFITTVQNGVASDEDLYLPNKESGFSGLNVIKATGNHAEVVSMNFQFTATTGIFNLLRNTANHQLVLRVPDDLLAAGFADAIRYFTYTWQLDAVSAATATYTQLALYKATGLPSATTVPPAGATEITGSAFNVPATGVKHVTAGGANVGSAVSFVPGNFLILGMKVDGNDPGVSGSLQICVHWRPTPGAT